MKIYVIITGIIFGLFTLIHIAKMFDEPQSRKSPSFIVLTLLIAALSGWAFRLVRISVLARDWMRSGARYKLTKNLNIHPGGGIGESQSQRAVGVVSAASARLTGRRRP